MFYPCRNLRVWHVNYVRELQNVVERAVILCGENGILEPEHLGLSGDLLGATSATVATIFAASADKAGAFTDFATLAELEKEHIFAALDRCQGNRTRAARILDVSIRTLRNKLHEDNGTGAMSELMSGPEVQLS